MLTTRKLETLFVEALLDYTFTIYVKPDVIRLVLALYSFAPLGVSLYVKALAFALFRSTHRPGPRSSLALHVVLNKLFKT